MAGVLIVGSGDGARREIRNAGRLDQFAFCHRSLAAAFFQTQVETGMYKRVVNRREAGTRIDPIHLKTVASEPLVLPDPAKVIHLQFRRFAGCPICDLHLAEFTRRHKELEAARVREVAVFHSDADSLRPFTSGLPFATVPDPQRQLYAAFGVDSAARALADPRAWPALVAGVARSLGRVLTGKQPLPSLRPSGGSLGLPADFLIAPGGELIASHYGNHAYDQWSVDEVLALAPRVADNPSASRQAG